MSDTIKIYYSADTVLIRSAERDIELSRAEADALVRDARPAEQVRPTVVNMALKELAAEAPPWAKPKSRIGNEWTKADDEQLRLRYRRGETMRQIGEALGRTIAACNQRLYKAHGDLPRRSQGATRLAAE